MGTFLMPGEIGVPYVEKLKCDGDGFP